MRSTQKSSVSLCMIVRDEAHQLEACLAPVADLFDEIVIVDTGSRDNTREVAARFTPKVFPLAWCDDFSAARNEALKYARGDWIFWLDADDRVSPENAEKLRDLFAQLSDAPQAWMMETVLHQDDQARDRQRITSHLRLFRRHPGLRWHRRVHETLTPWPKLLGHEVLFSDVRINHLGYSDLELTQRKLRRNVRLLQMDFAVAPDDPCVLMDLGNAHAQLGFSAEARHFLQAVLAQGPWCPLLVRRAYTTLGELETVEGNYPAAAKLMEQALQSFPADEYLLYMHSEALFNLGNYCEARAALKEILRQRPGKARFEVGVPSDIRDRLAPLALGEVLRAQVALREAEQVLCGVANKHPDDSSAWFFLGRVYIDWRCWSKLEEVIGRLSQCPRGAFFAVLLRAWQQVSLGRWLAAEQMLDELIPQAPCMTLLRLLRLECVHRRNAPRAGQEQACRDVLRLQPHHAWARDILRRLEASRATPRSADNAALYSLVVVGMGVPPALV